MDGRSIATDLESITYFRLIRQPILTVPNSNFWEVGTAERRYWKIKISPKYSDNQGK